MIITVHLEHNDNKNGAFHQALESNDPATARSVLADDVLTFEGGVERSADEYASHHMASRYEVLSGGGIESS